MPTHDPNIVSAGIVAAPAAAATASRWSKAVSERVSSLLAALKGRD